jgi:hypothetical protein
LFGKLGLSEIDLKGGVGGIPAERIWLTT